MKFNDKKKKKKTNNETQKKKTELKDRKEEWKALEKWKIIFERRRVQMERIGLR